MNKEYASSWERVKAAIFHLFPHHFLSRCTYWITRQRGFWVASLIRSFIKFFKVDLSDAEIDQVEGYTTFNQFFTRNLKDGTRPIDDDNDVISSPCDGRISQFGAIDNRQMIQAKGKYYSLNDFFTSACSHTEKFIDGQFMTIYLSPRDYHRVHMACDARLLEMVYVPGRLFSVAPYAPKAIEKVFAKNERVVSIFEVEGGYMAATMVGAVNVAAIDMAWHGMVTPPHMNLTARYDYQNEDITLNKGDEMGTFNMGSTVVLCFSKGCYSPLAALATELGLKMGETIGHNSEQAAANAAAKATPEVVAEDKVESEVEIETTEEVTTSAEVETEVEVEEQTSAPVDYITTPANDSDTADSNKP